MESVRTPFEVEIRLAVHDPSAGMIETTFAIGTPLKKQSGHYSGKNSYLYPPGLPRNTKYTHTE